jgi:MFS family permease
VVNAYLIAFGGLIVFTAASLLCGFSISQPMLMTARFVQGTGGAELALDLLRQRPRRHCRDRGGLAPAHR